MAKDNETEEESNAVDCINVSAEVVRFEIEGTRYKLKPLEVIPLNKAYALPKHLQPNRDPVPSSIELLTGKKVLPVTDPRAKGAVGARSQKLSAGS